MCKHIWKVCACLVVYPFSFVLSVMRTTNMCIIIILYWLHEPLCLFVLVIFTEFTDNGHLEFSPIVKLQLQEEAEKKHALNHKQFILIELIEF